MSTLHRLFFLYKISRKCDFHLVVDRRLPTPWCHVIEGDPQPPPGLLPRQLPALGGLESVHDVRRVPLVERVQLETDVGQVEDGLQLVLLLPQRERVHPVQLDLRPVAPLARERPGLGLARAAADAPQRAGAAVWNTAEYLTNMRDM